LALAQIFYSRGSDDFVFCWPWSRFSAAADLMILCSVGPGPDFLQPRI
jgi:hypothetical protein